MDLIAVIKKMEEEKEKSPRTVAKNLGLKLKETQLGFIDAGFTEEQAFELVIKTIF